MHSIRAIPPNPATANSVSLASFGQPAKVRELRLWGRLPAHWLVMVFGELRVKGEHVDDVKRLLSEGGSLPTKILA